MPEFLFGQGMPGAGVRREVLTCGRLLHKEGLTLLVDGEEEPFEGSVEGENKQFEFIGLFGPEGV